MSKSRIAAMILVLFVLVMGSSCEGGGILGGDDGDSCRNDTDCGTDLYCYGPNLGNVCGMPPREFCATDTDCFMNGVCHAVWDGCSTDSIGSECKPPCIDDMGCGPDYRCNASGACEPRACDEGITCPDRQKCDAAIAHDTSLPMHARSSGCVNIDCADDGACPSGKSCVQGYCQDGLGTCREVMIVP